MSRVMDLYSQMGKELRELFKDLFDPNRRSIGKKRMEEILTIAKQIGGPTELEAELLYMDVLRYLENPEDEMCIEIMKDHALRLEQETRDI